MFWNLKPPFLDHLNYKTQFRKSIKEMYQRQGICNSGCLDFNLNFCIHLAKGLKICKAQRLTNQSCCVHSTKTCKHCTFNTIKILVTFIWNWKFTCKKIIKWSITQLIKMTNQMVPDFVSQNDHLLTINMSKSICTKWQDGLLMDIQIVSFKTKFFDQN